MEEDDLGDLQMDYWTRPKQVYRGVTGDNDDDDHIDGTIFGQRLLNTKRVNSFSLQLLSETFLVPRTERVTTKNCTKVFM